MKSEPCFICNQIIDTTEHKAFFRHLKNVHNITKKEYLKRYVYTTEYLSCACGCKQEVSKLRIYPYKREYISGHNSRGESNPMFGKSFPKETIQKMKKSAKIRMAKQIEKVGYLPYHSPDAIKKRGEKQTNKYIKYIENNCDIKVLETHRAAHGTPRYLLRCNSCSHEFIKFHASLILCPICHPPIKSKYENEIYDWLGSICDEPVIRNNRSVLSNGKELDFYIPGHNIAIEFNGLYYHTELSGGKYRTYHLEKTIECEQKNIHLIQIFEDEWVKHSHLIKQKILYSMGKLRTTTVYARNTTIKNIDYTTCANFLDAHHIQGKDRANIRLGIFNNNVLVAVMTFSKQNAARGKHTNEIGTYELSRYAADHNILCVGGFGKLLKHFIKTYNPIKIITYADRRWSHNTNNVYNLMGFKLTNYTSPGYWYYQANTIERIHRFNFTKQKTVALGGDPNKTEWENMQSFGYDRVWDCGNYRYEWTKHSI